MGHSTMLSRISMINSYIFSNLIYKITLIIMFYTDFVIQPTLKVSHGKLFYSI